ncbi:DEKNAAC102512 [Brettanomyces naardenensis]|uniref:DEKNAAC102512 n=1 Tax=Brettanomyces naardenensis TaxID=13370 RepID=A0A448YL08_BRENA|nr:DEKNAAC102512 [Brettanomyces naardenensis]
MVASKRKVASELSSQAKRKKGAKGPKSLSVEEIKALYTEIKQSPKYYNNIVKLQQEFDLQIESIDSKGNREEVIRALVLTLAKVFELLISTDELGISRRNTEKEITVAKWLRTKYRAYLQGIFNLWHVSVRGDSVVSLQIDGLNSVMNLLRVESDNMGPSKNEPYFAAVTFRSILGSLLTTGDVSEIQKQGSTIDNPLVLEFYEKYFSKQWDVKYVLFEELGLNFVDTVADSVESQKLLFSNLMTLVKFGPMYPTKEIEEYTAETLVSRLPSRISDLTKFRSKFEKAWAQIMGTIKLTPSQYKSILLILHKRIIPFSNNPTRLMDFLTDSYNLGFEEKDISISILALNGLWELMKSYNLEYPNFYSKLYAILTPQLLHLNYRSRFLRLLDLFMSSTHLSATIVASFIKKLSRLSLTAPAAGVISVIPFIYNLLKRHPTCMLLIHNVEDEESKAKEFHDPFNDKEIDPSKTNALESSLWELETMMNHYHPQVASLAKILSQPFGKNSYNIEDFLDWSYQMLLDSELKKKFKGELSVEFEKWDTLYGKDGYMEEYTL